jgi:hypothetical protein
MRHTGRLPGTLLGLVMLAPGVSAEPTEPCPRPVTLGCIADGAPPDRLDRIIHFDTSPGSADNYFSLKPHGPKGRTKRCTETEILIEERTVRFAIDRRTDRYSLVVRSFDGAVDASAGTCTDISAPPGAGKPRQ